jgi:hypothetical protein
MPDSGGSTGVIMTTPTPDELAHQLEQLDDEQWYQFLDQLDQVSRRRRQRPLADPASPGRDDVAAWVARKHFIADSAVNQIWYLPSGAPNDEIRLMEVNDRLAGPDDSVRPIDFGLDIAGAQFKLVVADVTSEQLRQIQQDPSRLPSGWTFDGATPFTRRQP